MITLAELIQTKPLTQKQRQVLHLQLQQALETDRGQSMPYKFKVGDKVENHACYTDGSARLVGTVSECYRENGHNRVATEQGFFREQDLRISTYNTKKGN